MNTNTYRLPSETACAPLWATMTLHVLLAAALLGGVAEVMRVAYGAG